MAKRTPTTKEGLFRYLRTRKDGTVYETPTWYCRARIGGRDVTRSTGETDRRLAAVAARRIRAELETQFAEQRAGGARRTGSHRKLKLADLADWDKAARARKGVSRGQAEGVRYSWDRLLEWMGDIDPKKITYDLVCRYADERLTHVSGQTVRKELQALRRGLGEAADRGHHVVIPRRWPQVPTSPPNERQRGHLHPPEVLARWLEELRSPTGPKARRDPRSYLMATLLLHTGLRVQEARRLEFSWVRPAPEGAPVPAYLHIPAPASKTRRARVVALVPVVLEALLQAHELAGEPGVPLLSGNHRRSWMGASERIGYRTRITPRDLRHCYASYASTSGDLVAVREAMGHTNLATTSRYVHAAIARTTVASTAVADTLRQAVKSGTRGDKGGETGREGPSSSRGDGSQ